jgi:SAM-dependent methyltransferase
MSNNSYSFPLPPRCPNCLQKEKIRKAVEGIFSVYFCHVCHNGFTHPSPKNIQKYYHDHYWTPSSYLGYIKNIIFNIFQRRRIKWLTKAVPRGTILDVGSGERNFGSMLPNRYKAINIEPPGSKVKSERVIKKDFLKWDPKQTFDAVCFWESLEHTPRPQKYLEKAYKLLNTNGKIFIEFPNYNCLESRLFGQNWFHLDLPRHLVHITDKGIYNLLERSGFKEISLRSVLSFEYGPWGRVASFLNGMNINITDKMKQSGNLLLPILLAPFTLLSFILEVPLFFLNQSPINLAIAKKE